MEIAYISYNQLTEDIKNNLWKIPRDIDLVLAVPRSGYIVASIVTKFLNVDLMPIQDFCALIEGGATEEDLHKHCYKGRAIIQKKTFNRILVVDDTIYSGGQLNTWKKRFEQECYKDFNFRFMTAYKEWNVAPDVYLRDVSDLANNSPFKSVIYEWTLFYRYDLNRFIAWDLDGVFCIDPPSDEHTEEYEAYIKNAIPLYQPLTDANHLTTVITYRINKYRDITAQWLVDHNIYCNLIMVNAQSREERAKLVTPWYYKAAMYQSMPNLYLYVESNDYEAQMIHQLCGKPVLCITTNKMYN